jgi:AraC-like DNA-binding protein
MADWRDQLNPQLHLVWHGAWRQGNLEPPRLLYDHELVVVTKGVCVVEVKGERISCRAPYFIIVPPLCRHLSVAETETFRYCVHFDWERQRSATPESLYYFWPDRPPPAAVCLAPAWVPAALPHGPLPAGAPVLSLIQSMAVRWLEDDPLSRATCRALLLEILLRLLSPSAAAVPSTGHNRQARLALEMKNRLDFITLTDGSLRRQMASMGYAYEHLCRVFGRVFGVSPLHYCQQSRLEHAKRLLAAGGWSVKQVAVELQFRDPAYFSRVFKRYTGQSPRAFVRDH